MQTQFKALSEVIKEPLKVDAGVKTDNSILMIYPPEKELEFREYLLDTFIPQLSADGLSFKLFDLTGFLFKNLNKTNRHLHLLLFSHIFHWIK